MRSQVIVIPLLVIATLVTAGCLRAVADKLTLAQPTAAAGTWQLALLENGSQHSVSVVADDDGWVLANGVGLETLDGMRVSAIAGADERYLLQSAEDHLVLRVQERDGERLLDVFMPEAGDGWERPPNSSGILIFTGDAAALEAALAVEAWWHPLYRVTAHEAPAADAP